ncbi:hypothetical protein LTR53_015824 [Teratosphaeriaceae sp. CCFEE 6253]|nr:hypothetical protein LTR53_015824 [Teratosphaeriaceae sp. CCFEE 6253]
MVRWKVSRLKPEIEHQRGQRQDRLPLEDQSEMAYEEDDQKSLGSDIVVASMRKQGSTGFEDGHGPGVGSSRIKVSAPQSSAVAVAQRFRPSAIASHPGGKKAGRPGRSGIEQAARVSAPLETHVPKATRLPPRPALKHKASKVATPDSDSDSEHTESSASAASRGQPPRKHPPSCEGRARRDPSDSTAPPLQAPPTSETQQQQAQHRARLEAPGLHRSPIPP